jgi:hypothetical protein
MDKSAKGMNTVAISASIQLRAQNLIRLTRSRVLVSKFIGLWLSPIAYAALQQFFAALPAFFKSAVLNRTRTSSRFGYFKTGHCKWCSFLRMRYQI